VQGVQHPVERWATLALAQHGAMVKNMKSDPFMPSNSAASGEENPRKDKKEKMTRCGKKFPQRVISTLWKQQIPSVHNN
jgi:hypothetical protein